MKIDPLSKTVIFSDGLNPEKTAQIHEFCKGKIKDAYGIGTNLTNDCGVEPLNMVIKLTGVKINNKIVSTVKLSDDPGKHTGDPNEINLCKKVLGVA